MLIRSGSAESPWSDRTRPQKLKVEVKTTLRGRRSSQSTGTIALVAP